MSMPAQHRPGRNDPCWCGLGKKYKDCHLDKDNARDHEERERERAEAEREGAGHVDHLCARYEPRTHKVAAVQRPDFVVAVRNLSATGPGAWLHIDGPADLGRDQASVDEAIALLAKHGVCPDFRRDPPPPIIAATQDLLDKMLGRGVFRVEPSGNRLRSYGRVEVYPDGGGFVGYLTGRYTFQGVMELLCGASALDAAALGIQGGLLADVWTGARVVRELVRNQLDLPTPFLERAPAFMSALVERISASADEADRRGVAADVVRALAALPYLVGIREAIGDPTGQLEGMGLKSDAVAVLLPQLEAAADSPEWLLGLADLAGEDWDTPDGYGSWLAGARSVDEVAGALDGVAAEPAAEPAPTVEPGVVIQEAEPAPVVEPAVVPSSAPAHTLAPFLFSEIDIAVQEQAAQREALRERLAGILDRGDVLEVKRRELKATLTELDSEEAVVKQEQEAVSTELETQAETEARSRHRAVLAVLARGAGSVAGAAEAWSQAQIEPDDDHGSLVEAERTVREYEEAERQGLIERLPAGLRAQVQQQAEVARTSLRLALGGREPITVPVVVVAEAQPALVLTIGLPITGGEDLMPGSLQTVVALAFADVLADVVRSMSSVDVVSIDHDRWPEGGSRLRLWFSGPPPVTADDCAQYCASLMSDLGSCAPLRAAGVAVQARVEPDLDFEVE